MNDLNLREIEAVLAIARRGTFRAAAIDCGVSSTALSHLIAKLEMSLGVRLFNRTTRSVSMTDAGQLFIHQLGPAIQGVRDGLEMVKAQGEHPSGTVRINAAIPAAQEILVPIVLEYLRRYPAVHVDLVTEGRLVDIVAQGFDLGVRTAGLVPSDMIAVSLNAPQRYAVVAAPAYLHGRDAPRSPADLQRHDCIRVRLPDGALYSWGFEREGDAIKVNVPGRLTLDEGSLARAAALAGSGIAYLHEITVRDDIVEGRLVQLLVEWTPAMPGLCFYYPGRRHLSAAMSAFIALAREFARARGADGYITDVPERSDLS